MIESNSVHHLMLDVSKKMGASANVDGLGQGKGIECHTNSTGTASSVLKNDITGLVSVFDPLNAA